MLSTLQERVTYLVLAIALFGELTIVFANIAARGVFHHSFTWTLEAAQFALTVLTFIGGAAAYGAGMHLSMRAVVDKLPPRWRHLIDDAAESVIFVVSCVTAVLSVVLLREGWDVRTPVLQVRDTWLILPVTVGFALVCTYSLRNLSRRWTPHTARVVGAVAVFAGAVAAAAIWLGPLLPLQAVAWISLAVFALLLLAGVPIAFVLLASPTLAIALTGVGAPTVVALTMQDGTSNFILLAIPFFVLAGLALAEGGASARIIEPVQRLVGRFRGGLLQVVIVSMYFFSGLSGSKAADMAAVGTPLAPVAEKCGYGRGETAAALAASAVMGEIIPPSLAMLVLSSVTTVSLAALFVAGLFPAVLLAFCLMVIAYLRARVLGTPALPGPEDGWRGTGGAVLRAGPALLLPVILIAGIGGGIGTPTEVSSIAVIYGFLLSVLAYRMSGAAFWHSVKSSVRLAGLVLFIVTAADGFAWALNAGGIPEGISRWVLGLSGHPWMFMAASIAALVVVGAVLEGLPALLIFAPLLLPAAAGLGISPLQYALVLIVSMGIGTHLPPIGVGAYIASTIANAPLRHIARPLLGYLAVLMVGLTLLAAFPGFSLALPRLLGLPVK